MLWGARCRGITLALTLILGLVVGGAHAASAPSAAPTTPNHAVSRPIILPPASSATDTIKASPEALKQLVATLQDDQRRAVLIRQIQALIAVEQSVQPPAPPLTPAATLMAEIETHFRDLASELVATEGTIIDAPVLWSWFQSDMADPKMRHLWLVITEKLAVIFSAALAADWLVRKGFKRLRRASLRLKSRSWFDRAALLLLHLLINMLPPLAFAGVALMALPFVNARSVTTGVTTVAIDAVLTARLLIVLARAALITPRDINWPFLPISDETASYLFIWTRRFVNLTVYGFALGTLATLLNVPDPVTETLDKLVALLVAILAIVFANQNRLAVADWLRPNPLEIAPETDVSGDTEAADLAPPTLTPRHPMLDFVRHRVADIWHALATGYIAGVFIVYALKIEGGFSFLARASLLTVAVILAARLLIQGVRQLARRGFAIPDDLGRRFPTLDARTNRYIPALTSMTVILIRVFAVATLFEVWGVSAYAWFSTTLGEQLTGKLLDIGVVTAVALFLWEAINASIDRYLETIDGNGVRVPRSARMRTLLPLLRNAALVILLLIAGLLIFSELGINIAPLLAGAGVVGLAVGFGSQALVKDVITGLFMVIENTIAVGDLVELAGHSGIVEALSIRTVKLRDAEGALHTIPFGEISSVKNRSREFSHQVITITVARGTDVEAALAIMQHVADELKEDPEVGIFMLNTIDLSGISAFDGNGIQLQGRIKTLPLKNGAVGSAFYQRLDHAFAEAGIALTNQEQVISFGASVGDLLDRFRPVAPPATHPSSLSGSGC